MDTSRNKFSNIICIVFSVVLALLFCYAVGIRFGIANMVSRAIIAAVYCAIVVGLAFVLNRIVKMVMSRDFYIDDDKVYLVTSIVDSILFVVMRLLVISDAIKVEFATSNVYEMAKIGEDGKAFVGCANIDAVFATMLSFLFKLFGNTFFPVYLIQFIFSALAFGLIMYSVNRIIGRFASGFVGAGMAVLPIFYKAIARDSADCLLLFLFAFVLFLTAKYKKSIENDRIKIAFSLIIGFITGVLSLFSAMFLYLVIIPIIVLWDCRSEYTRDRAVNTFIMITGNVFGYALTLLVDSYLITKTGVIGFAETITQSFIYRFSLELNTSLLRNIVSEPCIYLLMVLSIIFCVMFWKNEDDTAHIPVVYWILLLTQVVFIRINNQSAVMMLFALLLLIIASVGIFDLGYTESLTRIYRLADDMEPAVITSIEDKATNIQINLPVENSDIPIIQSTDELITKTDDNEKPHDEDRVDALGATAASYFDYLTTPTEEKNNVTEEMVPDSKSDDVVRDDVEEYKEERPSYFDYLTTPVQESNSVSEVSVDSSTFDNSIEEVESETDTEIDSKIEQVEETDIKNEETSKTDVKTEDVPETDIKSREYKEERKSSDYGINDVDFESLFSNTNIPPKSVYKEYFDVEEISETEETTDSMTDKQVEVFNDVSSEDTSKDSEIANNVNEVITEEISVDENDSSQELVSEENILSSVNLIDSADEKANDIDNASDSIVTNETDVDEIHEDEDLNKDSKDKKAYVDSFFGYLYDGQDDLKIEEEKPPVKEEYVSHADKFADLDLDLGFDAFDNVSQALNDANEITDDASENKDGYEEVVKPVVSDWYAEATQKEEESLNSSEEFEVSENKEEKKITNFEEEFVFDFSDLPNTKDGTNWEPLKDEFGSKDNGEVEDEIFKALSGLKETSVETVEEFSFEETKVDAVEPVTEELVSEKVDEIDKIEEFSFNNTSTLTEEEFFDSDESEDEISIEEMLEKKIDENFSYEEALNVKLDNEEIDEKIGFSYEEALEKKLAVEESISNAIAKENFSFEEALSDKIVAEDSLEEAALNNFESVEHAVSGKLNIEDLIDSNSEESEFSFQEALETKLDVEQIIEDANNDKMLEEFGDESLFKDLDMSFSGLTNSEITDEVVKEEFAFNVPLSNEEVKVEEPSDNITSVDDIKDDFAENSTDIDEPVKFIENPLPLPKKHVPREMDYGRVIPSAWMHYDVEVDKSNNFYDI